MRDPGIEPGSSAWKAEILTTRLIALENFKRQCKCKNLPFLLILVILKNTINKFIVSYNSIGSNPSIQRVFRNRN